MPCGLRATLLHGLASADPPSWNREPLPGCGKPGGHPNPPEHWESTAGVPRPLDQRVSLAPPCALKTKAPTDLLCQGTCPEPCGPANDVSQGRARPGGEGHGGRPERGAEPITDAPTQPPLLLVIGPPLLEGTLTSRIPRRSPHKVNTGVGGLLGQMQPLSRLAHLELRTVSGVLQGWGTATHARGQPG